MYEQTEFGPGSNQLSLRMFRAEKNLSIKKYLTVGIIEHLPPPLSLRQPNVNVGHQKSGVVNLRLRKIQESPFQGRGLETLTILGRRQE